MVAENQTDNHGVTSGNITLSYKQIGAIVLVILNLLVIAPGSWFLKTLWTEARTFKNDTEEQFKQLKLEIGELKVDLSSNYVTRQSFNNYREQMAENMRYMDSKVTGVSD